MPDINIKFIGTDDVSGVMKKIGGNFSKMGSSIGKIAGGVALGGVAALGAGFVALGAGVSSSIKEGQAFTKQMSNVGAVSNASAKEMETLTQVAKDLGATTAFSGVEAAEGMQFLAQAGFKVTDIVSAMPGVLDLAAASGADLGTSADIVSNIMSGFGAQAKDTGKFVDILTKTFTTSNVNIQQLGESMKFAAPTAKSFGQSVDVTAASLGILGNAGLQGATAGEKFRSILSRLAGPTSDAQEVMDELGISVFDASGTMRPFPQILGQIEQATAGMSQEQRNAALATLFSMENAGAFSILLDQGQGVLEDYAGSLRDSVGVASEVATKQLDNLSGDVTLFQSALSGVKLDVFAMLEPLLRRIVQVATEALGAVPGLLESINTEGLTARFSALAEWLQTNLPVAIQTAATYWQTVLQPALMNAWSFIQTNLLPIFMNMVSFVQENIPLAIQTAANVFSTVLIPVFQTVSQFIVGTVLPNFLEVANWLSSVAPSVINAAVSAFQKFASDILPIIVNWATIALARIKEFRDSAILWFQEFRDRAQPIIEQFVIRFQEAWAQAGPLVTDALQRIGAAFAEITAAMGGTEEQTDGMTTALDTLQQVLDAVVIAVQAAALVLQGVAWGIEKISEATKIATGLLDNLAKIFTLVGNKVPDILKPGSPPPLANAMRDIANATEMAAHFMKNFAAESASAGKKSGALISQGLSVEDLAKKRMVQKAKAAETRQQQHKPIDPQVSKVFHTLRGMYEGRGFDSTALGQTLGKQRDAFRDQMARKFPTPMANPLQNKAFVKEWTEYNKLRARFNQERDKYRDAEVAKIGSGLNLPPDVFKEIFDKIFTKRTGVYERGPDNTSANATGGLKLTEYAEKIFSVMVEKGRQANTANNINHDKRQMNLTINTNAPSENIAADFQSMQARMAAV